MAWTKKQIILHIQACRAAGIADEHRKLILRQLPNAMYDRDGHETNEPTSTSKRLDNRDFEQFMATVESYAGGKLDVPLGSDRATCPSGHWASKAEDQMQRMRHKAYGLATVLELAGKLEPKGVGLRGWIEKRVTKGGVDRVHQLNYEQLHALINGLRAYARRHGIKAD